MAHDLGERLVDANVPKIVVEEAETGGGVDEERVEKRALARRALRGPREPVAQGPHGAADAASVPAPRIQIWAASASGCARLERQSPESDGDQNLDERLPAAEVERHEDHDAEIERRVELAGRLEEGDLGDDQRRGQRDQPVRRAGKPLVAADDRDGEQAGCCDRGEHGGVEVSDGGAGRDGERAKRQESDRAPTRAASQRAPLPGGQLNRAKPDALSEGESHRPVIGRKPRGN